MLARKVQGGEWIVGVFSMCGGDVSQRERGDRVCGVPCWKPVKLSEREHGGSGLPVQCWIQRARRGKVCCMLCGIVQGRERVVGVRTMQWGDVFELHRGHCLLDVSFGESVELTQGQHRCDRLSLRLGLQWTGWGRVCGMLAGAVQGGQRLVGLQAVQCWDVSEHQCWDGMRDVPIGEPVELDARKCGG